MTEHQTCILCKRAGMNCDNGEKHEFNKKIHIQYLQHELSHGITIDDYDSVHQFYGELGHRAKMKKELERLLQ